MSLYTTGKMPEKTVEEYPSESKASTYEEAKAAAEKRENQKAVANSDETGVEGQEKASEEEKSESPLQKNQETEKRNPENPEKLEFPEEQNSSQTTEDKADHDLNETDHSSDDHPQD